VFGQVISGMQVVKKIGLIPTGQVSRFSDVPTKPIKINSVKVLDKGTAQ
jgi:cyclophilin family peptidyl-prolyl cis-trans isomerase